MKNARGRIGLVPTTYVNLASLQERAQAKIQPLSYAEEVYVNLMHVDRKTCRECIDINLMN